MEQPNVTKVQSYVMLVLHNVRMVPSNVRKNKGTSKCEKKVLSHVIFVLHNMRMVPSSVRKKNKRTTKYDKSSITCDTGTRQCEDDIIKFEKKIREPPNVTKVQSYAMSVLHNVMMVQLNVRKKIREPLNVTKVQSHVMLILYNVRMVS